MSESTTATPPTSPVLPGTEDVEHDLLARLLLDPSQLTSVATKLRPCDFSVGPYRQAYEAMLACQREGRAIDISVLRARSGEQLMPDEEIDITRLTAAHRAPLGELADVVHARGLQRELMAMAGDRGLISAGALTGQLEAFLDAHPVDGADSTEGAVVRLSDVEGSDPVVYLIDPLLAERQVFLLFGDGGVGKSYLAAAMAVSLASGVQVLPGLRPAGRRPVLVLDYETDAATWKDRTARIKRGAGVATAAEDIYYLRATAPITELGARLRREIARHHIEVLIVDSVGMALPPPRPGVDANDTTLQLYRVLRSLGTAVLLIDHVSHADSKRPYGSIYKSNQAREAFLLTGKEDGDGREFTLQDTKRNSRAKLPPFIWRVSFDDETVRFSASADSGAHLGQKATREDEMVSLLRTNGPLESVDIADRMGISLKNVRTIVSRSKRRIQTQQDGRRALALHA